MNTIQQQKKKQLTFEEICPEWSVAIPKFLEDGWFLCATEKLDISNSQYCIVGEAHGFKCNYYYEKNEWYCETCSQFATDFCYSDGIQEKKDAFTRHWNEVHLNK